MILPWILLVAALAWAAIATAHAVENKKLLRLALRRHRDDGRMIGELQRSLEAGTQQLRAINARLRTPEP